MNKKDKITIFCQAPADVIHVLNLYEKYKNNALISIFCINVRSIYDYISSLNLNVRALVFIPYSFNISVKHPFGVIRIRKKLKLLNNKYFRKKENETIYFFSIWYDWITFYFLNGLVVNNSVIYYQYHSSVPEGGRKHYNFKEYYILLLYFLATGIKFQFSEEELLRLLFFYKKYNIIKQKAEKVNLELLEPYLFRVRNVSEKSILLFESSLTDTNYINNYDNIILNILNDLKKCGYSIYIKGHPRLGISKCIDTADYSILPQEIPAELIDANGFNYVMGIISVSIAFLSKYYSGVYSLINLFEFYDDSIKSHFIAYLNYNSNYKIKFIKEITELCRLRS